MGKTISRGAAALFSLSFAFATAAFNPAQARFFNNGYVGPDGETCRDVDGLPVVYDAVSSEYIAAGNVGISMAGNDRGTLRIMYDQPLLSAHPRIFRIFMLNHECGLHRLGYIKAMQSGANMETTANELSADCDAATLMTRKGLLHQHDIETIDSSLKVIMRNADWNPPRAQRIATIQQCYDAARSGRPALQANAL